MSSPVAAASATNVLATQPVAQTPAPTTGAAPTPVASWKDGWYNHYVTKMIAANTCACVANNFAIDDLDSTSTKVAKVFGMALLSLVLAPFALVVGALSAVKNLLCGICGQKADPAKVLADAEAVEKADAAALVTANAELTAATTAHNTAATAKTTADAGADQAAKDAAKTAADKADVDLKAAQAKVDAAKKKADESAANVAKLKAPAASSTTTPAATTTTAPTTSTTAQTSSTAGSGAAATTAASSTTTATPASPAK